jgi:two-component system phosphate regulon sensor histidine kinase PhoR
VTLRFRTKVFVSAVAVAAVSLLVAALLLSSQLRDRQRATIAQRLVDEARLTADLLSAAPGIAGPSLDAEADRLGQYIAARVTLIGSDGSVVGDSTQTVGELPALENHLTRPEVVAASERGIGEAQRYSHTVGTDMLYVAVRATHPGVRYVRLALPLTEIDAQLATIRDSTLVALATAVPVALLMAWALSAPLARRVHAIARIARRYSKGDLSPPAGAYGDDELGAVARALDDAVRELGSRLAELSRDRARTDAILTGMVEGVLIVDRDGRLQMANRAAQSMLHVDDSALGRPYLEVIRHPDIAAQLASALAGASSGSRELMLARDVSRTFVARAASVATAGGGGAVLVLHDISDLRQADQIRRDFVANVSHELRTPLTAVRGYAEALVDGPGDETQTRRFAETIVRQATGMERMVADLLRLARLDAHQERLDCARCDVHQLFERVVDDLGPSIHAKALRIVIDVPPEAAGLVADPAKLHDVLRDLVENAVNYSPDGSEIRLAASRDGEKYQLTVSDVGPGIPTEDLARVFERFYRVDKSRGRPGGTGLGLSIVKHLVELHGGDVTAANRPEGGATFTVRLPAGAESAAQRSGV